MILILLHVFKFILEYVLFKFQVILIIFAEVTRYCPKMVKYYPHFVLLTLFLSWKPIKTLSNHFLVLITGTPIFQRFFRRTFSFDLYINRSSFTVKSVLQHLCSIPSYNYKSIHSCCFKFAIFITYMESISPGCKVGAYLKDIRGSNQNITCIGLINGRKALFLTPKKRFLCVFKTGFQIF